MTPLVYLMMMPSYGHNILIFFSFQTTHLPLTIVPIVKYFPTVPASRLLIDEKANDDKTTEGQQSVKSRIDSRSASITYSMLSLNFQFQFCGVL
jgi:hypothetical protein